MKNYKQILEAINRGILLALDDFEDEESVLNVKSKLANHRDYTKEYLDLLNEVVDLSLPSGTLWCKYNLDVNPNLLSKNEDWYGGYYAWAELEVNKSKYNWSNYKFGKEYDKLTKYCSRSDYGLNDFIDNLTELLPEDDVAYLNKKLYNYKFHIPTHELCEELINCTKNYWIKNYDPDKTTHNSEDDSGIQGLNGYIFEGKNGNQLFIPMAGYHYNYDNLSAGSFCYLWSSRLNLDYPSDAYGLDFNSTHIRVRRYDRCNGFSVRPVINL